MGEVTGWKIARKKYYFFPVELWLDFLPFYCVNCNTGFVHEFFSLLIFICLPCCTQTWFYIPLVTPCLYTKRKSTRYLNTVVLCGWSFAYRYFDFKSGSVKCHLVGQLSCPDLSSKQSFTRLPVVASLLPFYHHYFGFCSSSLISAVHFPMSFACCFLI